MSPNDEMQRQLRFLEWLEKYGYITAGISFLLLGMTVFASGWIQFLHAFSDGLPQAVLHLMNELLLVVILLELFRTVVNFLKSRTISLEPFLYVGIIASVRRLLTVGAEMTLQAEISPDRFRMYLFDSMVNVGVILALVFALYLLYCSGRGSIEPVTRK